MVNFLKKFPFPLLIVIIYIFVGVLTGVWHPTWLLFLLIPAYYSVVLFLSRKGNSPREAMRKFPFPAIIVIAYLCLGFFLDLWHPGWLIFLLIPLYYAMLPLLKDN